MIQYIDKAAVVAEIIKRRAERVEQIKIGDDRTRPIDGAVSVEHTSLLFFLDTLDVKEVDLEKEMDKEWNKCEPVDEGMGLEIASIEHEQFDNIAKHFFELGMKLKNIKWKPCTEIPTEHWENNPAISPLYLVKCGSVNGNPILGYTHYSYASNSWMDCFHATEDGVWKVLEWTDKRDI